MKIIIAGADAIGTHLAKLPYRHDKDKALIDAEAARHDATRTG